MRTSSSTPPSNSVKRLAIHTFIASQLILAISTLMLYSGGNDFAIDFKSFFSLLPNLASCSADTPRKAFPDIFAALFVDQHLRKII
jgi:hypothetical protein